MVGGGAERLFKKPQSARATNRYNSDCSIRGIILNNMIYIPTFFTMYFYFYKRSKIGVNTSDIISCPHSILAARIYYVLLLKHSVI